MWFDPRHRWSTAALALVASCRRIGFEPATADPGGGDTASDSTAFADDLLAHWRLDDATGQIATDSAGSEHHGTLFGDTAWDPDGVQGFALGFDGAGDYVEVTETMTLGTDITITGWVKPSADALIFDSEFVSVFGLLGASQADYYGIELATRRNGDITGHSDVSSSWPNYECPSPSGTIVPDTWNFFAFAVSGTRQQLYANNTSTPVCETTVPDNDGASGNPTLAQSDTSWSENYLQGSLDDIRVYDRALSAAELEAVRASVLP